ncbi:MAG: hypothetical protein B6A08_20625 [Sorangiineae bacterium NIC37A_2]|nr:MAG: hypothetical protein B6A08_20625 [Sorangiineae bacterium NIC37A_2]
MSEPIASRFAPFRSFRRGVPLSLPPPGNAKWLPRHETSHRGPDELSFKGIREGPIGAATQRTAEEKREVTRRRSLRRRGGLKRARVASGEGSGGLR